MKPKAPLGSSTVTNDQLLSRRVRNGESPTEVTVAGSTTTAVGGSGTAQRVPYWTSARILASSRLVTDGNFLGIGVGVTTAPTDTWLFINQGNATTQNALRILSTASAAGDAALRIDSRNPSGGIEVNVTEATTAGHPAKGIAINHASGGGNAFEVDVTAGTPATTSANGIAVTLDATATGTGVGITNDGTGTALNVLGAGDYGAVISANGEETIAALIQNTDVDNTVTVLEVSGNGRGATATVTRAGSIGSSLATAPTMAVENSAADTHPTLDVASTSGSASGAAIDASTAGSGDAVRATATGTGNGVDARVDNDASSSAALYATGNGAGASVDAIATGEGNAIHADVANLDSTAATIRATHAGNGTMLDLYRNVDGATAHGVLIHLDHVDDGGSALRVVHDGDGLAAWFESRGANGIEVEHHGSDDAITVTSATGACINAFVAATDPTTNALFIGTNAGTGPVLYLDPTGGGLAIESLGKTKTVDLQITAGSPEAGMVPIYQDTAGNLSPGYPRAGEPTCLNSLYIGNETLCATALTLLPGNPLIQVPLDLPSSNPGSLVCNDQWDTSSRLGLFTPSKTADPTGVRAYGMMEMNVHFDAPIPGGWTAADVQLWIVKNGATLYRIDVRPIAAAGSGYATIHLHGVFADKFTGTDTYSVHISRNAAAGMFPLNTWEARVATKYTGTTDCADCTP